MGRGGQRGVNGDLVWAAEPGGLPLFAPLGRPLYVHYADPPEHVVLNDSCTVVDRARDAGCAAMRGVGASPFATVCAIIIMMMLVLVITTVVVIIIVITITIIITANITITIMTIAIITIITIIIIIISIIVIVIAIVIIIGIIGITIIMAGRWSRGRTSPYSALPRGEPGGCPRGG